MKRGRRREEDWSEYQEYNNYSGRDLAEASTNSPALDTYLAEDETSRHPSRKLLPLGMLLAIGGVGVLLVCLLAVWIGRSTPGRTTTVHQPAPLSPQQAAPDKNATLSPDIPKPPAQPETKQDKNLMSQLSKGVVQVLTTKSSGQQPAQNQAGNSGTGFVIDRRGYVLTNAYVVGSTKQIAVILHDGTKQLAALVATDPALDVAVLKMPQAFSSQVLSLGDSNDVQLGEAVNVLSFPPDAVPGNTVSWSDGQVSSFRQYKGERWFEITLALTPKYAGGPLVRAGSGVVVGLVSWQINKGENEPIVFIRPIKSVRNFLTRHIK